MSEDATRTAAPIALAEGAERVGLATMLADLIRQNLAQHPRKWIDFNRLSTVVAIEVRDAEVGVSLEFSMGSLVIHAGVHKGAKIRISADAESVLALCMVKIVTGVPHPLDPHNRRLLKRVLDGEILIVGAPRSTLQLIRFTRLMSVRR